MLQERRAKTPNFPDGKIDINTAPFADALRLFPTRDECHKFNAEKLGQLAQAGAPVFEFRAVDIVADTGEAAGAQFQSDEADENKFAGLLSKLRLAVGAKVMVRRNLNLGDGIVNGARGVVTSFVWSKDGKQAYVSLDCSRRIPPRVFVGWGAACLHCGQIRGQTCWPAYGSGAKALEGAQSA